MRRRVVITGIGCVTPLGRDPMTVWRNLLAGQSGVRQISLFDASGFPVSIAGEVPGWSLSHEVRDIHQAHAWPRQTQFAVCAAIDAWISSGHSTIESNRHRYGISLGCGELFPEFQTYADSIGQSFQDGEFQSEQFARCFQSRDSSTDTTYEPGAPLAVIASHLGFEGDCKNYTTACASSSIAIGEAIEVIRRDEAEVMLAGGAHSMIHPMGITGFDRLSVLSHYKGTPREAYRPFDRTRDGFVIGEGSAILVLEELDAAMRRGAPIMAELAGYGSTHDAFRVTDVHPEGRSAARAINLALQDARLNPEQIGYINAHGSGTIANDKAETVAIKQALGPAAFQIPVSGTKSMTGHLTTACGSIETMVCVMAVNRNEIPPTINYHHRDPDCDLDYVPNEARETEIRYAMNNNFGFGGNNVALVVSKYAA